MSLYQSLLEQYGYNEPIVSSEIEYKSYSRPWIYIRIYYKPRVELYQPNLQLCKG